MDAFRRLWKGKSRRAVTSSVDVHHPSEPFYHEKQVRQLCALHSLNSLFGGPVFTKAMLDQIDSWMLQQRLTTPGGVDREEKKSAQKSVFGFGNYDVNVIMLAVQARECEALWWNRKRDVSRLNLDHIVGFIVNMPARPRVLFFPMPFTRRHWFSIRACLTADLQRQYFNFDSKLDAPSRIGNDASMFSYLSEVIAGKDRELLVIVPHFAAETGSWLRSSANSSPRSLPHCSQRASNSSTSRSARARMGMASNTVPCTPSSALSDSPLD